MSAYKVMVNNSKLTEATYKVSDARAKALRIKAQDKVNYQLIDEATGNAPQNMTVKRVGKNLQIAFEGKDIANPDIVIENYYDFPNSHLVAQSASGDFYEFEPSSQIDAAKIANLSSGMTATQVVGKTAIESPLWSDSIFNSLSETVGKSSGLADIASLGLCYWFCWISAFNNR